MSSSKMADDLIAQTSSRSIGGTIMEVALCSMIGMFALFGNVLVAFAVIRSPKLRTSTTTMFIHALAIADILTAVICAPITCAILASDDWINTHILCQIQGFAIFTLALMSIGTLALTAVNRFFRVAKPTLNKRFFTKRNSWLLIGSMWLSVIGFYAGILASNSTHIRYEPSYAVCAIAHTLLQTLVEFVFVIIALITIVLCYTLVFVNIRKHQVSVVTSLLSGQRRNSNLSVEEIKISKLLFMTVLAFAVCWVPSLVIITMDRAATHTTPPRARTLLCTFLNYLSAALNPIIYGVMNRSFRAEYKKILLCRKTQVGTPQDSSKNARTLRNTAHAVVLLKRCATPVKNELEMTKQPCCPLAKQEVLESAASENVELLLVQSRSSSPCYGKAALSNSFPPSSSKQQ